MLERKTIVVRGYTEPPREVITAALERLEGSAKTFSERADYLLAELRRQGYRVKRR
jgi:hypothetical protein